MLDRRLDLQDGAACCKDGMIVRAGRLYFSWLQSAARRTSGTWQLRKQEVLNWRPPYVQSDGLYLSLLGSILLIIRICHVPDTFSIQPKRITKLDFIHTKGCSPVIF